MRKIATLVIMLCMFSCMTAFASETAENAVDIDTCEFFWNTLVNYPLTNDRYPIGRGDLYVGCFTENEIPYDIYILSLYKSPKMKNGTTNYLTCDNVSYIYGLTEEDDDILKISIIDNEIINEQIIRRDVPMKEKGSVLYKNNLCSLVKDDDCKYTLWCRGYPKSSVTFEKPVKWLDVSTAVTNDGEIYKVLYSNAPWQMKPILVAQGTENQQVNAGNILYEKNGKTYIILLVKDKDLSDAFTMPKLDEKGIDLEKMEIDGDFISKEIKR